MTSHHQLSSSLSIIIFFFLFLVDVRISFADDEEEINMKMFNSCRTVKFNCGVQQGIGYPFWGSDRPQYCGHPGYKLDCQNGLTQIESMSTKYRVLRIDEERKTMRIVESDFLDDACTPSDFTNATRNLSLFSFQGVLDVDIFYGCPSEMAPFPNFPYTFKCRRNTSSTKDGAYFVPPTFEMRPQVLQILSLSCDVTIQVPMMESDWGRLMRNASTLGLVLREGFQLSYSSAAAANFTFCDRCFGTGGQCGFNSTLNQHTCFCGNTTTNGQTICRATPADDDKRKKNIAIGVAAGVGGGFILACFFAFLFFYLRRRKNRRSISSNLISQNISPDSSLKPDPENGFATPIFSYKELEEATNNFDSNRELGDGGFGTVYRGELRDGRVVAVKRLYENNFKRVEQFMNEVNILSLLRHENLVTLYGCTSRHSRELLLVYEYVPNGTVADHIHGELAKAGLATWPIRMNIAIESAGALKYLHASEIIHRDVKTNNILLDKNFHVKVADFGLSRLFPTDVTHVSTAPQGTPGYVDPEYYQCYQLTDKSDVYSFGVVLIELISSKPAVDISRHRHDINLANMAINKIQNHSLSELVDPGLGFETDNRARRMITLVAELAFRCLQQDRDMRPSMVEVLEVLKGIAGDEYNVVKEVEVINILEDHDVVGLLKNNTAPFSPVSVTDKWGSIASTPNTSS